MIYQELLYSRSLSKDYRWMIVPSKVSPESLKTLNQLYNLYDKDKGTFSKSSVSPLYCLNDPEMTFLVSCGLSNHKDKDGRDIYSLQGISVPHEYRRHFWFILPWILVNHGSVDVLNTWENIDFSSADGIVRRTSGHLFFKLDQLNESLEKLAQMQRSTPEKLLKNESMYVSFDKSGLKELSHVVSLSHDCIDFAFGATQEMAKNFNFRIVAKVGSCLKIKTNTRMASMDLTPSLISDDKKEATNESIYDPIDRFDPRKKAGQNRIKGLKGNSSSRILGQYLPRFLSVFKIGEKIKRYRSASQKKNK